MKLKVLQPFLLKGRSMLPGYEIHTSMGLLDEEEAMQLVHAGKVEISGELPKLPPVESVRELPDKAPETGSRQGILDTCPEGDEPDFEMSEPDEPAV